MSDKRFGFVDGKLVFLRVAFLFRGFATMTREEALDLQARFEAISTKHNSGAPVGVNQVWQVAYDNWAWLELRGAAITNAVQGIVFSLLFSFIILLLMTRNFYVSLLSIICISSIII